MKLDWTAESFWILFGFLQPTITSSIFNFEPIDLAVTIQYGPYHRRDWS